MKIIAAFVLVLASLSWGQTAPAPVKLLVSDGMIEAVNLSAQPIIEIELRVVGRPYTLTFADGDHNANIVFRASHDFFFKVPLGSGAKWEVVHYLAENVPYQQSGVAIGSDSSGNPAFSPVTTAVSFIQYADGSTWGSPDQVTQDSMAKRKDRWTAGHAWLNAYYVGGTQGFLAALASETKFPAEAKTISDQVAVSGGSTAAQGLAQKLATADALMATGKF